MVEKDIVQLEEVYGSLEEKNDKGKMYKVGELIDWAWKLVEKAKKHSKERVQLEHEMVGLSEDAKRISGEL
jgi:hypothetical protein